MANGNGPHLKLVQGEFNSNPPPEIIHSDTDMDIRELISDEMYQTLIDPATGRRVNEDSRKLQSRLFNNPAVSYGPILIDLSRVDKDYEGLGVEYTEEQTTLFPGLIGLEGFDYVSDDITDKIDVVRLYMGVMLAHRIAQAKLRSENFFKMIMIKHFSEHRKRGAMQARKLQEGSAETDTDKIKERFRMKVASFVSGVALHTLFEEPEREVMLDVLERRYEQEKRVEDNILDVAERHLMIPASHIPKDNYSAEARGFASPLNIEEVNMILQGRPGKVGR